MNKYIILQVNESLLYGYSVFISCLGKVIYRA